MAYDSRIGAIIMFVLAALFLYRGATEAGRSVYLALGVVFVILGVLRLRRGRQAPPPS